MDFNVTPSRYAGGGKVLINALIGKVGTGHHFSYCP